MTYAGHVLLREEVLGPDYPPADPDPMDDEFTGPSLDTSKWTWLDQGTATATEEDGILTLAVSENANRIRGIYQSTPVGNWTFRAKSQEGLGSYTNIAIHLFAAENATGEVRAIGIYAGDYRGITYSTPSSGAAAWGTTWGDWGAPAYWELDWDGTTLSAGYSLDGRQFFPAATDTPAYTPSLVGLGFRNASADIAYYPFEWFRRWA